MLRNLEDEFRASSSKFVLMSDDGTVYVSEGVFGAYTPKQNKDVKSVCEIKR